MEKDKTILTLIERLKLAIDFNSLQIVDYWDADLCAVGIRKGNKLIYVSTYNYRKDKAPKFDYHVELLNEQDVTDYETIKKEIAVSETDLIVALHSFLDVEYI